MIETECCSETSVQISQTTRRHIPESSRPILQFNAKWRDAVRQKGTIVSEKPPASMTDTEDGANTFHRNANAYLPDYTASLSRTL
jgi:hypothetical protein